MSTSEVYVPTGELNGASGDLNGHVEHVSNGLPPAQPGSSKASAPLHSNGSNAKPMVLGRFPQSWQFLHALAARSELRKH